MEPDSVGYYQHAQNSGLHSKLDQLPELTNESLRIGVIRVAENHEPAPVYQIDVAAFRATKNLH